MYEPSVSATPTGSPASAQCTITHPTRSRSQATRGHVVGRSLRPDAAPLLQFCPANATKLLWDYDCAYTPATKIALPFRGVAIDAWGLAASMTLRRGQNKVRMSCTELADRNGAFAHERADRAAASSSLRKTRLLSMLSPFPVPGSLWTPFDNLLLTALSCGRTFLDSAVKFAPYRCG
jgi:hypothetical protein